MFKIRPVSTGVKFEPGQELESEKYLVELNWKDTMVNSIVVESYSLDLEKIKKNFFRIGCFLMKMKKLIFCWGFVMNDAELILNFNK